MVAHDHNTKTPYIHLVPKDPAENLRFRRWVADQCRGNPRRQAQLKEMCRRDLLFYINVFCWVLNTKDFAKQPVRPFLSWLDQDRVILDMQAAFGVEDLQVVKSRDMGGTELSMKAIEYGWHFHDYQSFLVCSRNEDLVDKTGDTRTLFHRIDFTHKFQPTWLLPTSRALGEKDPNRINNHVKNADNGSVIDGTATTPNMSVGDKRTGILLDERALMENNVAISTATREATKCRLSNSTPRGTTGDGAEFWRLFKSPHTKTVCLWWWMHPDKRRGLYTSFGQRLVKLDPDYEYPADYEFILDGDKCQTINAYMMVEGVKRKMRSPYYDYECGRASSDQEIAQELDGDFLSSGWSFFRIEMLEKLKAKYGRPPVHVGELSFDITSLRTAEWRDEPQGRLSLWGNLSEDKRLPLDHQYVIGMDVATGIGGEMSSNSAMSVFDKTMGEKVAEWVSRTTSPEDMAKYAMALGYWFNGALLIPESNGPGGQLIKVLLELGYQNLFYGLRDDLAYGQKPQRKPGWAATKASKPILLGEYGRALRDERFPNPSLEALREAGEYMHMPSGKIEHSRTKGEGVGPADEGENHGDRVIGDALAWLGSRDVKVERAKPVDEIPPNSYAFRQQRRQAKRKERKQYAW
jgi:hypothetical protein